MGSDFQNWLFGAAFAGILIIPVSFIVMLLFQTHREDARLALVELIAVTCAWAAIALFFVLLLILIGWAKFWWDAAYGMSILAVPAAVGGFIGMVVGWFVRRAANSL